MKDDQKFITIERPNGSTYRIYYSSMCPAAQAVLDGKKIGDNGPAPGNAPPPPPSPPAKKY